MKRMHCGENELRDRIPFYLYNNVTRKKAEEIEKHVAECEECQEDMALWLALLEQRQAKHRS
jgi:anti-sigma factor RsiW